MLRYAIVLQVAVVATAAFSAPVVQPATSIKMSTADAINACRAELGKHGKYLQVKRCVAQKKMSTTQAINICRAGVGQACEVSGGEKVCAAENEGRITYAVAINGKNGTALFALDRERVWTASRRCVVTAKASAGRFAGAPAFSLQLTPQSL